MASKQSQKTAKQLRLERCRSAWRSMNSTQRLRLIRRTFSRSQDLPTVAEVAFEDSTKYFNDLDSTIAEMIAARYEYEVQNHVIPGLDSEGSALFVDLAITNKNLDRCYDDEGNTPDAQDVEEFVRKCRSALGELSTPSERARVTSWIELWSIKLVQLTGKMPTELAAI